MRTRLTHALTAAALVALTASSPAFAGGGMPVTYQGRLDDGGSPYSGTAGMTFSLFNVSSGGTALASSILSVDVTDGLFTALPSFDPSVFDGSTLYLEVEINGTILSPRQEITVAPYAARALNAPFDVNGNDVYYSGGYLGVGVSDPLKSLHVRTHDLGLDTADFGSNDTLIVEGSDAILRVLSDAGGGTGSSLVLSEASGGVITDSWSIRRRTNDALEFINAGTVMFMRPADSDGAVGIGTTTPDGLLDVENNVAGQTSLIVTQDAASTALAVLGDNTGNVNSTLDVVNQGLGFAAEIHQDNAASSSSSLRVTTDATQSFVNALSVQNFGAGHGGEFITTDLAGTGDALRGIAHGDGCGIYAVNDVGDGYGVWAEAGSSNGVPFLARKNGGSGDIAIFQWGGGNRARIDTSGRGYFNNGTQVGGADVAELFEVEGDVAGYEPGDVLVISTELDRTVAMSSEPYSTLVAGVHATKAGILLSERHIDASHDDTVPMGVVGVIPTKVSAENGPIRRGDLLVTASIPGHAMKGTERDRMVGAIIGKALEEFDGPGAGVIRVMVNVK